MHFLFIAVLLLSLCSIVVVVVGCQEPGGSGGGGSEAGSSVRLREQERFGIFFQDDYDYLQHLRVPGTAVLEPIAEDAGRSEGGTMERAQEMDGKDKVGVGWVA